MLIDAQSFKIHPGETDTFVTKSNGLQDHLHAYSQHRATKDAALEQHAQQAAAAVSEAQQAATEAQSLVQQRRTQLTYYVDGNAETSGDGIHGQRPFKTIEEALLKVNAHQSTDIVIRGNQSYTLAPGRSSRLGTALFGAHVRLRAWSHKQKPHLILPHHDHPKNGWAYANLGFGALYAAHLHLMHIELTLQPSPQQQPQNHNGSLITIGGGALLGLMAQHCILNIPPDYSLIGTDYHSSALHLQLQGSRIQGGGNLVKIYRGTLPCTLMAPSLTIATDTYILNRGRADRQDLLSAYSGNQLMRTTV